MEYSHDLQRYLIWDGNFTSLLVLSYGKVSNLRVTILPKLPSRVSPSMYTYLYHIGFAESKKKHINKEDTMKEYL